jgi:hypothetical protein
MKLTSSGGYDGDVQTELSGLTFPLGTLYVVIFLCFH